MADPILFYMTGDKFGEFSNFFDAPILVDGKSWPSTEHYFQAQKFVGTEYEEVVRKAATARRAAALGRERTQPLRSDWEEVKNDIMLKALRAKFTQHDNLKALLLSTGTAHLVEHTVHDAYWADGGDGSGMNMLGRLLEQVRAEISSGALVATIATTQDIHKTDDDDHDAAADMEAIPGPQPLRSVNAPLMPQAPRLTGVLRAMFTGRAPLNLDEEWLARRSQLQVLTTSRKPETGLEWKSFAGPLADSKTPEVRARRTDFHRFLQLASTAAGNDAPDPTVTATARAMYKMLSAKIPNVDVAFKRQFGQDIAPAVIAEMKTLAETLSAWRPHATSSLSTTAAAAGPGFGHDISIACRDDTPYSISELSVHAVNVAPQVVQSSAGAAAPAVPSKMEPAKPAFEPVDATWLLRRCEFHVAADPNGLFDARTLADRIVSILQSARKDELQGHLLDLLGPASFEFMQLLYDNAPALRRVTPKQLAAAISGAVADSGAAVTGKPLRASAATGTGVTIWTQADKDAAKAQQKADRRRRRAGMPEEAEPSDPLVAAGFDPDMLSTERGLGLQKTSLANPPPAGREAAVTAPIGGFFQQRALPDGTVRSNEKGFERVHVPAPVSKLVDTDELIPISRLPDWAQLVFKGVARLNRLQSQVFEVAFNTNDNMLVCAPTGAGKTNVAMLTVCQTMSQHMLAGSLQRDAFKIVYVAPMKALAQEVVEKFSKLLQPLGIVVRELTGDMQLSKREIDASQIIVTTPEKWDVITRKANDGLLVQSVKLLIIDEVHLLADERGAVLESIVARTLRHMETSQSMVRIVGLSATLPNYKDVALFLGVNLERGLFYFDPSWRPVPLEQTFIGVSEHNALKRNNFMNLVAFNEAMSALERGKQVMVFVHSRKDTAKTARALHELAMSKDKLHVLCPWAQDATPDDPTAGLPPSVSHLVRDVGKSRNREVQELFRVGLGIHHAGMVRSDRTLSEKLFGAGVTKILVCTATLAWGINLPAHTVIIKGTQVYNAEAGGFSNLSYLDVMQIFGRAGRPQFDTRGHGIIITPHDTLAHYVSMLTQQNPIESCFIKALPDHLNAEIVSGTVTNIKEAVTWLSYTYLYIRLLRNPLAYGVTAKQLVEDPQLEQHRANLISNAAEQLDSCKMIRFHKESGNLAVTSLGRVASHFYIRHESVETFNNMMRPVMSDSDIFDLICHSQEFENIRVREEEMVELETLSQRCVVELKDTVENTHGKVNVLLQAYISNIMISSFTLISDRAYITQSAGRITRALFEMCLNNGWGSLASRLLTIAKSIDKQMWWTDTPLRQFPQLNAELLWKLEQSKPDLQTLRDMTGAEIGILVRQQRAGDRIHDYARQVPHLEMEATIQPITRGILRINLSIVPDFTWSERVHGSAEPFWIWVEDTVHEHMYHKEYLLVTPNQVASQDPILLVFTVPIFEPLPPQYWIRAVSDKWLGSESVLEVSFRHLLLPDKHPPHTDLLDLTPLPRNALQNPRFESIYNFSHFNAVQTQIFHVVYHTDKNVLLGAPTGSGKTVCAELAIFRLLNAHPGQKAVYVAPLKALARERLADWTKKFGGMGYKVVELTGDFTPDVKALASADILITTPEKWDGVSRGWQRRNYVKQVGLVIIDEIHLLGEDRGPILEVIVSRMRYIATHTDQVVRIIGLSTALANARDLADWLGIERVGLYNFRPSVRPVPLEVHVAGFPGKHYCPRMATMNKPTYAAITTHSATKPALVFVSSRRQTRLTALELIAFCATEDNPKRFLHMDESELAVRISAITDDALRHTLVFGIGIHHAGLNARDRDIVEELFCTEKIQVLVCTSTLAWGVNFPAHLVVVKGTEYFDGKLGRYVDFPVTDVLQMMGRAGRPQFDNEGVACILVHEPKKQFYRKFLYEPFPVESHLKDCLHDHFNAEVVAGTIACKQDGVDYLTWTYLFRRVLVNPSFYGLDASDAPSLNKFLRQLVDDTLADLEEAGCLELGAASRMDLTADVDPDSAYRGDGVTPTTLGRVASYYYISYKTVGLFNARLMENMTIEALARLLCDATEFGEVPVRHNEDELNVTLSRLLLWKVPETSCDSSHTKTFLLLQAHLQHVPLPISDYVNDTKSVVDQMLRVLNAMVDIAADKGLLTTTLRLMQLSQCIVQGRMPESSSLLQLPHVHSQEASALRAGGIFNLPQAIAVDAGRLRELLHGAMSTHRAQDALHYAQQLPHIDVGWSRDATGKETEPVFVSAANEEPIVPIRASSADEMFEMRIKLSIVNRGYKPSVHAPRFGKGKEHGWWLVLGDDSGQLHAMKRISITRVTNVALKVFTSCVPRDARLTLYLMSDCIAGLDQQYSVPLLIA